MASSTEKFGEVPWCDRNRCCDSDDLPLRRDAAPDDPPEDAMVAFFLLFFLCPDFIRREAFRHLLFFLDERRLITVAVVFRSKTCGAARSAVQCPTAALYDLDRAARRSPSKHRRTPLAASPNASGVRSRLSSPNLPHEKKADVERVLSVCSQLESVTGEVTTEAKKLRELTEKSPALNGKKRLGNSTAVVKPSCASSSDKLPAQSKSTDPITPRGQTTLHWRFLNNKGGRIALYVILLVFALAGTATGIIMYSNRTESWDATVNDGEVDAEEQPPWMSGPRFKNDAALSEERISCRRPLCSERVAGLLRSLNKGVHPCQNFYGHVCSFKRPSSGADMQQAQETEHKVVAFFKRIGSTDEDLPVAAISRRLWKDCVDLATLNRQGKAPLRALLKLAELGGWPFGAGHFDAATLPNVWKAAGKLQRLMALAPLIKVIALSDGTLWLTPGDPSGSVEVEDVLVAMMEAAQRNVSRLRDLAADVAELSHRLTGLREHQASALDDHEPQGRDVLREIFLESAMKGLRRNVSLVRADSGGLVAATVKIVSESSPQTVLNLLGYKLVRQVDLFTEAAVKADLNAGASNRESLCVRAVLEDALSGDAAEYVRYAALRSEVDFDLVRSVAAELKRTLGAKLAELRWMDTSTLKSAQSRLRNIKVRFFFDRYEGSNDSALADYPAALPSRALATYQHLREVRFRNLVLQGFATEDYDVADQHCAYDANYEAVFVRLSVLDVRDPQKPLWPVLQAAQMGPHLARCLLRVLLPTLSERRRQDAYWSPAARTGLDALRGYIAQDMLAVADNGALGPARDVYNSFVARLVDNAAGVEPTEEADKKPPQWDQVFYMLYARSLCEDPDQKRRSESQIPHWERVNGPLSNDKAFAGAFKCQLGEPMHPRTRSDYLLHSESAAYNASLYSLLFAPFDIVSAATLVTATAALVPAIDSDGSSHGFRAAL
ncbi:membrane metallo-endopeptidase-like 1 [Haemaphysalis longicornis]